ncbi:hypothetical protein N9B31_03925 [Mariniblastus sp.]|nr:hypothetical protein [Mariniblastus sp.]MDB4368809.1 hypothetical protein [bacterium]MDA7905921.1 hypothetical protein [Mariniblastus sp.]MDA7928836.1 hypothetical protein [Mariniblastus sp.]MDB4386119.1 hypothetical protein [bacterium]
MLKIRSSRMLILISFLFVGSMTGMLGCSEPTSATADKSQSTDPGNKIASTAIPTTTPVEAKLTLDDLPGIWLGNAVLDQSKLTQKISSLTPEQQELVLAKATSFLSTIMAVEYKTDGTLENDLEMVSMDGQVMRDGSQGNWRVLESRVDGLVIETSETLPNGTIAKTESFLKFFADGNRFVTAVTLGPDLQDCDAMIVFEKQQLTGLNVAEQNVETEKR